MDRHLHDSNKIDGDKETTAMFGVGAGRGVRNKICCLIGLFLLAGIAMPVQPAAASPSRITAVSITQLANSETAVQTGGPGPAAGWTRRGDDDWLPDWQWRDTDAEPATPDIQRGLLAALAVLHPGLQLRTRPTVTTGWILAMLDPLVDAGPMSRPPRPAAALVERQSATVAPGRQHDGAAIGAQRAWRFARRYGSDAAPAVALPVVAAALLWLAAIVTRCYPRVYRDVCRRLDARLLGVRRVVTVEEVDPHDVLPASALARRGWPPEIAARLLGRPDYAVVDPQGLREPIILLSRQRVERLENSAAFRELPATLAQLGRVPDAKIGKWVTLQRVAGILP